MTVLLTHTLIETKLGEIRLLYNDESLYWLSFTTSESSKKHFDYFIKKNNIHLITEKNNLLKQIQSEMNEYIEGERTAFTIPQKTLGTVFQQSVWQALKRIPYGNTISYKTLAININHPKAVRAVALANAANPLCILIPCHRVIQHDGGLGGYSGGLDNKIALLKREGVFINQTLTL